MANPTVNVDIKSNVDSRGTKEIRKDIKDLVSEMDKFRGALKDGKITQSEFNSFMGEATAKAKQFNTELKRTQLENKGMTAGIIGSTNGLLNMSKNLTVVGLGLRETVKGFKELGGSGKSVGDVALEVTVLSTQVLALVPAIGAVGKAFTMLSGTAVASFSAIAGMIAAFVAGMTLMVGAITHAGDMFGRLGQVLSGQMSYWDALKANIKDVTFGLIDLTDSSNKTDLSVSVGEFQRLGLVTQETSAHLREMQGIINGIIKFNANKVLNEYTKKGAPQGSYDVPLPPNFGYYDEKGNWVRGIKPQKKNGSSSTPKTEKKDAIDELLKGIDQTIKLKEQEIKLNHLNENELLGTLNTQLAIITATNKEILTKEQLVKLQDKELEIEEKKYDLLTKRSSISDDALENLSKNVRKGVNARGRRGTTKGPADDMEASKELSEEIESNIVSAFNQSLNLAQQIGSLFGEGATEVISAFQTAYSIVDAIVSLIKTIDLISGLLSFIPGGGAIGAIVKGLATGGPAIANTPYIVGERGPELFYPRTDGTVIPNEFKPLFSYLSDNGSHTHNFASGGNMSAVSPNVEVKIVGNSTALIQYDTYVNGKMIADKRSPKKTLG